MADSSDKYSTGKKHADASQNGGEGMKEERDRGMKWEKKGHEFDSIAKDLLHIFREKQKRIYIFGAGLLGANIRPVFERAGCFAGFIDNDAKKQETGVEYAKVISLNDFMEKGAEGLVVIAADVRNISAIVEQLRRAGLKAEADFFVYTEFMERIFPILLLYEFNLLWVNIVQICLTERCSLKCKKCAHACYAVAHTKADMSLEMARQSADCFFAEVDMAGEFTLIGGEPFLYAELPAVIAYIGEKYRDKMLNFSITTNGTILPRQEVLDLCRKYHVLIRVSDYSVALRRLEKQYVRLKELLDKNEVMYVFGDKERKWFDYGFERGRRRRQEAELVEVFDHCKTPCREIRGNRYYFCVMARSVSENLQLAAGEEDYLDLEQLGGEDKKIFLEFQMGYSEKGYLDMCDYCSGAEAANTLIPAAEQCENNDMKDRGKK